MFYFDCIVAMLKVVEYESKFDPIHTCMGAYTVSNCESRRRISYPLSETVPAPASPLQVPNGVSHNSVRIPRRVMPLSLSVLKNFIWIAIDGAFGNEWPRSYVIYSYVKGNGFDSHHGRAFL